MKALLSAACCLVALVGVVACGDSNPTATAPTTSTTVATATLAATTPSTFVAEVWVDNWFALYVNGKLVGKDSVPITTERSFNSERITFTATYPLTIGILAKDYMKNASGLEYIGTPQQQIGDGGLIAQIRDTTTGKVVAVTNGKWKTLVVQRAPLNASCVQSTNPTVECKHATRATPTGWATSSFKDTAWPKVSIYSEAAVGVKGGYLDITWNPLAKLIWGSDLKIDNILLTRSPGIRRPGT